MEFLEPLQIIWDYLGMHQEPRMADVIVGFGNFNTDIARRAAELYHQFVRNVLAKMKIVKAFINSLFS